MCNGRLHLTLCTPELAWKHKTSNALVSGVADSRCGLVRKLRWMSSLSAEDADLLTSPRQSL